MVVTQALLRVTIALQVTELAAAAAAQPSPASKENAARYLKGKCRTMAASSGSLSLQLCSSRPSTLPPVLVEAILIDLCWRVPVQVIHPSECKIRFCVSMPH